MSLVVVGTNHEYSPVEIREKISFSIRMIKEVSASLREKEFLRGVVIISTCNRTEVYASCEDGDRGLKQIEDFISQYHEISLQEIYRYFYRYKDKQAISHLFSVACGLDSLILGETQILSQVKSSFSEAEKFGFIDEFLREIFHSAFCFTGKVNLETKISEGNISVGSIAMDFIKERIGSLKDKNILIIGTGKVSELVIEYLMKEDSRVVFVSNRTFQRAEQLAARIGASAVKLDDLKQFLNKADVVITATRSPQFIIRKELVSEITGHRILILDLAMPRDVDPKIKEIGNIDLFHLEDLSSVINRNKKNKAQEAKRAEDILDKEVEKLWVKLLESQQEPALWH